MLDHVITIILFVWAIVIVFRVTACLWYGYANSFSVVKVDIYFDIRII